MAVGPGAAGKVIGVRPGEKIHEVMIPFEESRNCVDMGDYYIIQPSHHWWNFHEFEEKVKQRGKKVIESFEYSSRDNKTWLTADELRRLVNTVIYR